MDPPPPRGSFREVAAALKEREREHAAGSGTISVTTVPPAGSLANLKRTARARRASSGGSGGSSSTHIETLSSTASAAAAVATAAVAAASAAPREASPSSSSPLVPASSPLAPSPDLQPLLLYDPRDVEAVLLRAASVLRDIHSSDWSERTACMRELQALLLGGGHHFDNFLPLLNRPLREPLQAQLSDLRSTVVREACVLLALLGRCLGDSFEATLLTLLPQLFRLLLVTIQVIREAANECLRSLLQHAPAPSGKLVSKVLEGCASPNGTLRLRCMELVLLMLEVGDRAGLADKQRHAPALQACLGARMADKSDEVRQKARQCLCAYLCSPRAEEALQAQTWMDKHVDERTKKLVREERARYEHMRFPQGQPPPPAHSVLPIAAAAASSSHRRASSAAHVRSGSSSAVNSSSSYAAAYAAARANGESSSPGRTAAAAGAPLSPGQADTRPSRPLRRAQSWQARDEDDDEHSSLQQLREAARFASASRSSASSAVRGAHSHSNSGDAGKASSRPPSSAAVAATPQSQHHRAKTVGSSSTLRRISMGGGGGGVTNSPGSTEHEAQATAAAGHARSLSASRGRSRLSSTGTPAALSQSQRSASSTRGGGASAAAAPAPAAGTVPVGLATPSVGTRATPTLSSTTTISRARSASAARAATPASVSAASHLAVASAVANGGLPLSPSQAVLGRLPAAAAVATGVVRVKELLDAPLSHSQRSQLILALVEQSSDSLWSKRVQAFEQLALIFSGATDATTAAATSATTAGAAAAAPHHAHSFKKVPEIFLLLDKLTLCLRAGLGDVHHRVVTQALQGCFALLTPSAPAGSVGGSGGGGGGGAGQLSEHDLRPVLERLLPDVFALLSHPKLALRERANALLNHLTQHFAVETLLALLVHKVLDAVHAVSSSATNPAKVRLAVLEYITYLLPLSGSYFHALSSVGDASGMGLGNGGGGPGQQVNGPMRTLLFKMSPWLSASADAAPAATKEPQLKRQCIALCQALYVSFADAFFPSLACLPVPTNRLIRKHLIDSLPALEARIAESNALNLGLAPPATANTTAAAAAVAAGSDIAAGAAAGSGTSSDSHGAVRTLDFSSVAASVAATPHQAPAPAGLYSLDNSSGAHMHSQHQQQQQQQQHHHQQQQQQEQQQRQPYSHRAYAATSRSERGSIDVSEDEEQAEHGSGIGSGGGGGGRGRTRGSSDGVVAARRMRSQSVPRDVGLEIDVHNNGDDEESGGYGAANGSSSSRSIHGISSSSNTSTFSAADIDALLQAVSSRLTSPAHRQAAFTQLLAYACSTHTVWQPFFERVLLALLDVATQEAELRGENDGDKSDSSYGAHNGSSPPPPQGAPGTMVAASLGVLEALLQNHGMLFDPAMSPRPGGAGGGGGVAGTQGQGRYIELVLRSMMQVLRALPLPPYSSSNGGSSSSSSLLRSPRAQASHALSLQAISVFQLASHLAPPVSLLLRLLLHALRSEQVHEGVLKLALQRLARLVDERLDGPTLMGNAERLGMQHPMASAALSPRSSGGAMGGSSSDPTLLSVIVLSLSQCTHSSVLVRKLVITVFVRLYARVEGLLLPALEGLPPLLVKLVHIYIEKHEQQQQLKQT